MPAPFIWFISLFFVVSTTVAQPDAPASGAKAEQFMVSVGSRAVDILNDPSYDAVKKRAELEELFETIVDIKWIGKFVLGRNWRKASDVQKEKYIDSYRTFLIKNYTKNLEKYAGTQFEVIQTRDDGDGEFLLSVALLPPDAPKILVDYKVRKQGSEYKIFDIIVEGVSLITTQRSEFASVVNRKGLDTLIKLLGDKSAQLAKN